MNKSFQILEDAIERIDRRFPGVPRQEVLLTRLTLHLQQRLSCHLNEALKPWGINETVWMSLLGMYASEDGSLNPSDLSDMLDSSRTNATRVSDEMVRHGWVERIACPDDRRKIVLRLTKQGIAFIETLLPISRDAQKRLWEDYSSEEKLEMERLMRKLLTSIGG
ncbi:MarR family transcriptional regulator [Paludibacterium paludis]|uniref:Transcriptional regulator n=1 Tax=Paludibacterium paludis TaxID=1225769 RepID=A0A918P3B4_9NEIS|nr:MarR family transcriptional regulator [Paludibacterium paludis]GGY16741.1 transcriptional regulator [Paludibacterium paludis]